MNIREWMNRIKRVNNLVGWEEGELEDIEYLESR